MLNYLLVKQTYTLRHKPSSMCTCMQKTYFEKRFDKQFLLDTYFLFSPMLTIVLGDGLETCYRFY